MTKWSCEVVSRCNTRTLVPACCTDQIGLAILAPTGFPTVSEKTCGCQASSLCTKHLREWRWKRHQPRGTSMFEIKYRSSQRLFWILHRHSHRISSDTEKKKEKSRVKHLISLRWLEQSRWKLCSMWPVLCIYHSSPKSTFRTQVRLISSISQVQEKWSSPFMVETIS